MRVWVDLTNSPHVLVMAPVIRELERRGADVQVTARDFAQTLGLLDRHGIAHTPIGEHQGAGLAAKARGLAGRSAALVRWAVRRRFDLALGHGSNDLSVAAKVLGVPSATTFDYEWAKVQHTVNCSLAARVLVPDVIPRERLKRYGALHGDKLRTYPGLKEEFYLSQFEPDPAVLTDLGLDPREPVLVIRTPPAVSLYHRFEHALFAGVLERVRGAQAVVLPRTAAQRAALVEEGGFVVPERAIDAPSLIAFADLVVSAGGTMNREAVALGTPVFTTFEGRLGAVDERLLAGGRLRRLTDPEQVQVAKRSRAAHGDERVRRPIGEFVDRLLP